MTNIEIQALIDAIRNETTPSGNTKERVATVLEGLKNNSFSTFQQVLDNGNSTSNDFYLSQFEDTNKLGVITLPEIGSVKFIGSRIGENGIFSSLGIAVGEGAYFLRESTIGEEYHINSFNFAEKPNGYFGTIATLDDIIASSFQSAYNGGTSFGGDSNIVYQGINANENYRTVWSPSVFSSQNIVSNTYVSMNHQSISYRDDVIGLGIHIDFSSSTGSGDVYYKFQEKPAGTYTLATLDDLPQISSNFNDDSEAAIGGIAVGEMYHTEGIVKVRLS
jgi:hypothetical protein